MKIFIPSLRRTAAQRPAGYFEIVLASGKVQGDFLVISPEAYAALRKIFASVQSLASLANCNCQRGQG